MEEKKSRRPGLQTTVRRIPSEAVKTTKNQRASKASGKGSSDQNGRKKTSGTGKPEYIRSATTDTTAQKQAEELTRASLKASEKLKNAIRFSMTDTADAKAPQAKLSDIKVTIPETEKPARQTAAKAVSPVKKEVQKPSDGPAKQQTVLKPEKNPEETESPAKPKADEGLKTSKQTSEPVEKPKEQKIPKADEELKESQAPGAVEQSKELKKVPEADQKPEKQKKGEPKAEIKKKTGDPKAEMKKMSKKTVAKAASGIKGLGNSGKKMTQKLVHAGKVLTKSSADNQMEKRQKRVYQQRLIILAILAVCVLFLGSCVYHVFHFDRNTTVNGVDVSGLSVNAAAEKMASESKNYSLLITGDGGVQDEIRDSLLQVKVTDPSGLKKAMRKQNPFTWITDGFRKKKITANISASFDEDRLKEDIAALSILQEDNMEEPVDATLTETDDGHYQIEKETIGSKFDVDEASDLIADAVGNYQRSVNISASQQHPQVYSTSKNLADRMKQWNAYLESAGISYNFPAKTVTLESSDLAKLLSDDGENVTVSYAKVADLMANWRETYDTYNNSFKFKTESGETIKTWYEGDYGYELDEEGTAKDLIANIKAGDKSNHDPKWYHEGRSMDNMGLGDTYVEVSIEDQHLWVHKDGEVVVDTDVVTGNPNPDDKGRNRETYKGCYAIKGKYEKVTLGSLDVQGYASPVNYWVPFNGGEGLHDAPWRDEFGGTIYQNNGSHGCVNCPEDMMGKIYANVEKGEAVIIY